MNYTYGSKIKNIKNNTSYQNQKTISSNIFGQGGLDFTKEQNNLTSIFQEIVNVCPAENDENTPVTRYIANSSFGAAAGTYIPAGTYNNSEYYTSTNGWTIYFNTDAFVWLMTPYGLGNGGPQDISHTFSDPDTAPLAGWSNGGALVTEIV